jgi:very-short-patch-repair endonuclease
LLQGKLPKEFLEKQNKLKDILTLEQFQEKLLSVRDDVEIISYNENYKKEKSLFLFKNFSNPVYMIPLSVLNGSLHPSQRAKNSMQIYFNKTGFENPSQNPEVRKKVFSKQGMSLPEKKINSFLESRNFNFKYNSQLNDKGKFWDFIIFKNNEPKIIIEIDGEFVHGLLQDGNSSLVNGIKDAERFQNIDEEIIYLQCDSKKIENLYEEILRVFESIQS